MSSNNKYTKIFEKCYKKDRLINDVYSIIKNNLNIDTFTDEEKFIYDTSCNVVAPSLILFVYETMVKAKEDGVRRLYFLARDRYIMYEIAKNLNDMDFNIDIRYSHCSRLSLRNQQ